MAHLAGSGRMIVRLSAQAAEGQLLCDSGGAMVARVMELIGPVKRPFASAAPLTNSARRYVGRRVYAAPQPAASKRRRR